MKPKSCGARGCALKAGRCVTVPSVSSYGGERVLKLSRGFIPPVIARLIIAYNTIIVNITHTLAPAK